jgi:biotin-dependent carboxylase-like uncharacterized protein
MIKVLHSQFGLSVQDTGRKGFSNIGVPKSGAMDLYSSQLANKLLNNHSDDAVLEITFGGCKLEFLETCKICITGAEFSAIINNKKASLNSVIQVEKGTVLSFGKQRFGVRTYLSVKGGFNTEKILNSRSQYKGITSEEFLTKGSILEISSEQSKMVQTKSKVKIDPEHFSSTKINCFKGPEYNALNEFQKKALGNSLYKISSNNNRMGYQLKETLENQLPSMLTSAVLPGTVQLTPSGKLIVLMRDCQVTGGYPRVLQLSEASINRLAQKTTGDAIRFKILC